MTFLDSSVIIDYLDDVDDAIRFVDEEATAPYFTAAVCVHEVLMGPVKSREATRLSEERAAFDWVRSLPLDETIAMEANRIQDELTDAGVEMPTRDALIAATARSTGDVLVVADADFETAPLERFLDVTNLRTAD